MKYPQYAEELKQLLEKDQIETKALGQAFWRSDTSYAEKAMMRKKEMRNRTARLLHILQDIGEPSISNIGDDGALAMSVLATHDSQQALPIMLEKFELLHSRNRSDCRCQSIPAMTDWLLILKRKPQRFGTQWLFDENKWPYLPIVEDFAHVNNRRAAYDLEPLTWPKSLATPESEQPWLTMPFSDMVMRAPTEEEWQGLTANSTD